jgi:hypothetical protein
MIYEKLIKELSVLLGRKPIKSEVQPFLNIISEALDKKTTGIEFDFNILLEDRIWHEQVCIYFNQTKKIKIEELQDYLDTFIQGLVCDEDLYRTAKEYKTHFRLWLNKTIKEKPQNKAMESYNNISSKLGL